MKRLLVIRFSALGDVAMTVPIIHDLASQYPDLEITIISRPMCEPLFELLLENVHFIAADLNGRHKGIKGLNKLLREIDFRNFDYVADLHDVLRTQWLRLRFVMAGKKVAHINKGRRGKKNLTRKKGKILVQQATSFERYAKVLDQLGFPINLCFNHLDYSRFREIEKPEGEHWIGIAPFAKHEAKTYPIEQTELVIDSLSQNAKVFLFGGGTEEKRILADICQRHKNTVVVNSAKGLAGEMALIQQLNVMLSMDSANMHLASLVGTPVVSIWGGTHPYAGFLGWNQEEADCVQLDMPCRPCSVYGNRPCIRGDYACLREIKSEEIAKRINNHLS